MLSRSLLCKVRLNIKKCLSVCLSVCPKTICLMIMLHHSLYSQYSFRKPYLYKTWHIMNDLYISFIFVNIELYILRIYTFLYFCNFYIYQSYEWYKKPYKCTVLSKGGYGLLINVFHHSLYSQYNSRKQYLNKKRSVAQNGIFLKNVLNKNYVKFSINQMSKIVFCKNYVLY